VFHVGYMRQTITLLQAICKYCSRVKLPDGVRLALLKAMRNQADILEKKAFYKVVMDRAKAVRTCPYCGTLNGMVKKIGALKLIHERYREKQHAERRRQFLSEFDEAVKLDETLGPHLHKAQEDLNPIKVMRIFSHIPSEVCLAVLVCTLPGKAQAFFLLRLGPGASGYGLQNRKAGTYDPTASLGASYFDPAFGFYGRLSGQVSSARPNLPEACSLFASRRTAFSHALFKAMKTI